MLYCGHQFFINPLLLFKLNAYFLAAFTLVVVLAIAVSSKNTSFSLQQKSISSVAQFDQHAYSTVILVSNNYAASFNHLSQTAIGYVFVALLALFTAVVVHYQSHKPTKLPPPWYIFSKFRRRIYIAGWKISNFQFKAQLATH